MKSSFQEEAISSTCLGGAREEKEGRCWAHLLFRKRMRAAASHILAFFSARLEGEEARIWPQPITKRSRQEGESRAICSTGERAEIGGSPAAHLLFRKRILAAAS